MSSSDDRLRELHRRWRTSQAPEDEARWLLERVRVGELARDRLEVAAYAGHAAARLAAPSAAAPRPAPPGWQAGRMDGAAADLEHLLRGLEPWGDEPAARAGLALARALLALTGAHLDAATGAVRATEAWLACPCPDHVEAARSAGERAREQVTPFTDRALRTSVGVAADVTLVATEPLRAGSTAKTAGELVRQAALVVPAATLRAAVTKALVAWALGP